VDATGNCTNSTYQFFGFDEWQGAKIEQGTLGLAPDYTENGTSFITSLYNEGVIPVKMFALFISS
jgi:hypothetical protein